MKRKNVGSTEQANSGFEDDPVFEECTDPGHRPPTHLVVPMGQRYRHVCPSCGHTSYLRAPNIRFAA